MKHPQEFGNSQRKLINFLERIVGFGISISCLCLLVVNPQFQSIDPIYVQEAQWVEINHIGEFIFLYEFIQAMAMKNFNAFISSWDITELSFSNLGGLIVIEWLFLFLISFLSTSSTPSNNSSALFSANYTNKAKQAIGMKKLLGQVFFNLQDEEHSIPNTESIWKS